MTSQNPTGINSGEPESNAALDLQFDKAEYDQAAPSLTCTTCAQPITGEYYLINGGHFCSSCKWAREGPIVPEGSSAARFFRAAMYGAGAAAAGSLIYFAISWTTGYEFGLIAIVVGWMVGKAVLAGSGNRGGRAYQLLAVFLTYCSIVTSYVPNVLQEIQKLDRENPTVQTAGAAPDGAAKSDLTEPAKAADAAPPADEIAAAEKSSAPSQTADAPPPAGLVLAVYLIFAIGIAFISPFLAGFQNILGLVILGIGLYEAWKHSARRTVSIEGPFAAGTPPPSPSTAGTA